MYKLNFILIISAMFLLCFGQEPQNNDSIGGSFKPITRIVTEERTDLQISDSIHGYEIYKKADIKFNEWMQISVSGDYYFDANIKPLSRRNGIVKIWTRMRLKPSYSIIRAARIERSKNTNENYSSYLYSKTLMEYDCNEKKIRVLSSIDYNEEGTAILNDFKAGEWNYAVPESVGEISMNWACQMFNK